MENLQEVLIEDERLDKILIARGLVTTRVRAEAIIRESGVLVNGKLVTKTGKRFPLDCKIKMMAEESPWVSRGAYKLLQGLEAFKLDVKGKVFLDIGASTGGFTEVLLQAGASKVYCVDVGSNQLHAKLAEDSRVVNLEKTHVRELTPALIPELADGIVIDVSFISLTKIFPFVHAFLKEDANGVILIKPQFEVGKDNVGKGGVVKDVKLFPAMLETIKREAALSHLEIIKIIDSPILGGDGNKEFLGYLKVKK